VGRSSGATGAPGEREHIQQLAPFVEQALKEAGYSVRIVPASFEATSCDAFLALHCDGGADPKASGFSVGYPKGESIELALQIAAAYHARCPLPFRGFNITTNMSRYYGYRLVKSPGKALLELGFITNPKEKEWLQGHKQVAAAAIRDGLERYFAHLDLKRG